MDWQFGPYFLPLLISAAVSAALALYAWYRRSLPGAATFAWLLAAGAWWTLAYALELACISEATKLFWIKLEYLGIVAVPVLWLAFVLQHAGQEKLLSRRNLLLLAIVPVVTLLMAWTSGMHRLFYAAVHLDATGPWPVLDLTYRGWFWVHIAYSYSLLFLGTILLVRKLYQSPTWYRGQAFVLLVGVLAPWLGNVLYTFDVTPFPNLDLAPFAFTISGLAFTWGLFRFQLLDLAPVARNAVIEGMSAGVIVLDGQGRIVDLNPAVERIIGRAVREIIGQPVDQAFAALPSLADSALMEMPVNGDLARAHTEIYLPERNKEQTQRAYDLRVSPLHDRRGRLSGRLIVLQDITARVQAESALQESETRYRSLFETMAQGVVYQGIDGQIISANPAAERILGLTFDQMQGRTSVDPRWRAIHPDGSDFPGETHPAIRALRTGEAVHNVVMGVFNPREERYTWINITAIPQFNPGESRPYQVYTTFDDITEQVLAEKALQEAEEKSRNIIESIPMGMHMYQLEPDGRLVFDGANPAADAILGVENAQFVGKTIEEAFPLLTETEVLERYRAAAASGQSWQADQVDYEEGQIKGAFEVHAFQTSPGRMAAAFLEITERKRAEQALRESEERYRQLFEAESDAIFLIENQSGRILEANSAASALYGYSREQLLTMKNTDLSAEPHESRRVTRETPADQDRVVTIPRRLHRKKDGTVFPVEITGRFFSWRERPVHIAAIRDITRRVQAQEERERLLAQIQEQAQRVQLILDTAPEGVLLLDADQKIVLVNPVAEKDLAILAGAGAGDRLTHLGDRPVSELLAAPPTGLWHETTADGRSFQVVARPIEAGAAISGWVMMFRDITQQREIQQRIQQQERLAAVGQLAAGIAHDFNNILTSIIIYAQVSAGMPELPAVVRQRMQMIDQQAERAADLIQQILDFSRRAVLERRPLDMAALLEQHARMLEHTLPGNIQITLDYAPGNYIVDADPARMQQMATNLALNARDAMREGGELGLRLERVVIQPGESPLLPEMAPGAWIRLTVSDTGAGIPPDVMPHIFEPFFTTRAPLGSGLGLSQVYGIVEQHGGRIEVETQPGQGTTFTICLPAHKPEPPSAAAPRAAWSFPTGNGELVLVVDDDPLVRKALVECLNLMSYQALEAANGEQALGVFAQHRDEISLLLCDMVMPKMSGLELMHALREQGLSTPVVMLTGRSIEPEVQALQDRGLLDWLNKPADLRQLAEVIARALAKQ